MKTTLIAAATLLSLAAMPALAGEGNGEPFPLRTPGVSSYVDAWAADTGSAAYPDVTGRPGSSLGVYAYAAAPDVGNEVQVATANSLPQGFGGNIALLGPQVIGRTPVMTASAGPRG